MGGPPSQHRSPEEEGSGDGEAFPERSREEVSSPPMRNEGRRRERKAWKWKEEDHIVVALKKERERKIII